MQCVVSVSIGPGLWWYGMLIVLKLIEYGQSRFNVLLRFLHSDVGVSLTERECLFFISMIVVMRPGLILSCLSLNMRLVQNSTFSFSVVWFRNMSFCFWNQIILSAKFCCCILCGLTYSDS